jgi:hypothetical protein
MFSSCFTLCGSYCYTTSQILRYAECDNLTTMCCQVCVSLIVSGQATETQAPFTRRSPWEYFRILYLPLSACLYYLKILILTWSPTLKTSGQPCNTPQIPGFEYDERLRGQPISQFPHLLGPWDGSTCKGTCMHGYT